MPENTQQILPDIRRCELQPALAKLADAICIYDRTDGFCKASVCENCECWNHAEAMLRATGLSANACIWVIKNKTKIEEYAKA